MPEKCINRKKTTKKQDHWRTGTEGDSKRTLAVREAGGLETLEGAGGTEWAPGGLNLWLMSAPGWGEKRGVLSDARAA